MILDSVTNIFADLQLSSKGLKCSSEVTGAEKLSIQWFSKKRSILPASVLAFINAVSAFESLPVDFVFVFFLPTFLTSFHNPDLEKDIRYRHNVKSSNQSNGPRYRKEADNTVF